MINPMEGAVVTALMWVFLFFSLLFIAPSAIAHIVLRQIRHESNLYRAGCQIETKTRRLPRRVALQFRRWERELDDLGFVFLLHTHNLKKTENGRPNCSTIYLSAQQTITVALSYHANPRPVICGITFPWLVGLTGEKTVLLSAQTLTKGGARLITIGMDGIPNHQLPSGFRVNYAGPIASISGLLKLHLEHLEANKALEPLRVYSTCQYLEDQAAQHELLKQNEARFIQEVATELSCQ